VHKADIAVDCGPQINPERIRSQFEGACVMGLGNAVLGEISFKDGKVQQDNFHMYEVARMSLAPKEVAVHLVTPPGNVPLGGVGGCVEDDLIARLHDGRIPADGPPVQLITYGVTREEAARFGLPCGGTLRLTEERVGDPAWVAQLLARCEAHEIVGRSLDIATG